jgi:hypothetical protein
MCVCIALCDELEEGVDATAVVTELEAVLFVLEGLKIPEKMQ